MIAFVYQKFLHAENCKKCFKILKFSFFPNFVLKLEAFELTHNGLILCFPVVFPVQYICRKFQYASLNVSNVIAWRKLKNIELTNIKISDKNFVPPGGAQTPEGESFLPLFWNVADFSMKWWVSKKFSSSIFYCLW